MPQGPQPIGLAGVPFRNDNCHAAVGVVVGGSLVEMDPGLREIEGFRPDVVDLEAPGGAVWNPWDVDQP